MAALRAATAAGRSASAAGARILRPLIARAAPGARVLEDHLLGRGHGGGLVSGGTRRLQRLGQGAAVTLDVGAASWSRWRTPAARGRARGSSRARSSPPRMPRAASASSTGATGRSSASTASWKYAPLKRRRTPGTRVSARDQLARCARAQAAATRSSPCGAHERQVDRRRRHQQALVGADVGGRLGAADVLLARLQREREARPAVDIERAADDAAGHLPHVLHARGHEAEVRAARGQRHAERLAFADGDVGAAARPTRPAA